MKRKTLTYILIGLIPLCLLASFFTISEYNKAMTLATSSMCPPLIFFEDVNGNGEQDAEEAEPEDLRGTITLYDSNQQKIMDFDYLGCFIPAASTGRLTLVVKLSSGYQATTSTRWDFETQYALDTMIYIGVQKTP